MKKIITGIAALAMLTSVFAVDFSSRVRTKISVAGGNIDSGSAYILETPDWDQKDADLLEVHFAGDKAGADFKFFANAAGENSVNIRHLAIWLKPIEMLKFNVGNISYSTFCEHTDWWKAPSGVGITSLNGWSNFATVEGFGAMMTLNPINGLEFNAGVTPGAGGKFMSFGDNMTTTAYGVSVKADLNAFAGIPVVAAASFRDAGTDQAKILAIGASYGNEWGGMFYGFINARMRFEKSDAFKMAAVTLDNWFKLSIDKFGVQLALPVTLRLTGLESDPSWMNGRLKVSYAAGAFTPYIYVETTALPFNSELGDKFGIDVKPGVEFSVGSCAVNAAVLVNINKSWDIGYGKGVNWSIPVEFSVAF